MRRALKRVGWATLAAGLGRAAGLIRRRPSGGGAAAWRAVQFSYSQFGEDLVVYHLLADRPPSDRGAVVDVGAFDPVLHSNTYLLYQHGWRGLNVDASPARAARFAAARPGDVNAAAAVSDRAQDVVFLEYPTPGTSRVADPADPVRANALGEEPTSVTPCRTRTLTELLDEHVAAVGIDFLNVDCEGLDLAALRGLDWSRWTPRVIAVEANTPADREATGEFLAARGYQLVSRHVVTLIFLHATAADRLPHGLRPALPDGGAA